jgi:hypothetical protein
LNYGDYGVLSWTGTPRVTSQAAGAQVTGLLTVTNGLNVDGSIAQVGTFAAAGIANFNSTVTVTGQLQANGGITTTNFTAGGACSLGAGSSAAGNFTVAGNVTGAAINASGGLVFNVATPTAAGHAATKGYVDSQLLALEDRIDVLETALANAVARLDAAGL